MRPAAPVGEVSLQPVSNADVRLPESIAPLTGSFGRALYRLAETNVPLLLVGERGSGKRTLASEIHRISGGTIDSFRTVNCANPDPDFWGSDTPLPRTVFFQEISQLSDVSQQNVLQKFFDVSGDGNSSTRPRLVASSRVPLTEDVRGGRFREDLYSRISCFCLCVPPLRQRKEDIPALAQFFAAKYSALLGRPAEVSQQVLELFSAYSWPGNVGELEYVVRTIVAIGDENIALAAIRASGFRGISNERLESLSLKQAGREASRRAERELILNALSRTHWNRKRAARDLQISYKALLYKLKQIGNENDLSFGVEA